MQERSNVLSGHATVRRESATIRCRALNVVSQCGRSALAQLADDATRIACRENVRRNVARHHAARADHGFRADANARQDDRSAADPYVRADLDGLPELLRAPQL